MSQHRALFVLACVALAGCVPVPSLIAQSTVIPLASAGQSAEPRGLVGANVTTTVRPVDLPASGEPSASAMYAPRVQLEPSLWIRAGRYLTLAVRGVIGFHTDSYSLGPTTAARPDADALAIGLAIGALFPLDSENRVELAANALLGAVPSEATYLPPAPPGGAAYTREEAALIVLASVQGRYVHQFGPASLITLLGVGTQPINGALGGSSSSMVESPVLLVGVGTRIDLTEWLAVQLLLVLPVGQVLTGPQLSLGFNLASREQTEPRSATPGWSPRPADSR